jgi:SAM-dependent methyltransferase
MTTGLIRAFWSFERALPRVRSAVWRVFYDAVATAFPHGHVHFMNWGYVPPDSEQQLSLAAEDEPHRTAIQLYWHTLGGVDLEGKDVVEVGSGRGGGSSWIARSERPRSMLGVDLAPRAVALATRLHAGVPALAFRRGNALELPLPDGSADAVVNVESCHHYGSMPRFLAEVRRVLRPGGHLLITDYREAGEMPALEAELAACGLEVVRSSDITANVVAALERDNEAKEQMLLAHVPRALRTIMRTFMGNRGTDVFEGFQTRRWLYRSWVLRKPAEARP